jgi:hypothetical protein
MLKDTIPAREVLEDIEYMFLFPIPKDSKGLSLQMVVPVKETNSKSSTDKSRRLKTESLTTYVGVMACVARGYIR